MLPRILLELLPSRQRRTPASIVDARRSSEILPLAVARPLRSGSAPRRLRGLIDQGRHFARLRRQPCVACPERDNLPGTQPFGHSLLVFWMDHSIFTGYLIPGWLALPGWRGDLVTECAADRGFLRHSHDKRLI